MKIGLVITGGTIACRNDKGVLRLSDAAIAHIKQLVGANYVDESVRFLSENISFADYFALLSAVKKAAKTCDAVIVTHGTDTLCYSAAYLAFAMRDTAVPIVLTASDKPLNEPNNSGIPNLAAALEALTRTRGVYVAYKNPDECAKIYHAATLFEPRNFEHRFIGSDRPFAVADNYKSLDYNLVGGVLYIRPYPGLDYATYNLNSVKAVVHDGYHSGTVNARDFNEFAARCPVPVFLCAGNTTYDGQHFCDNVRIVRNIMPVALYIKTLIGVASSVNLDEFLPTPLCNEFFD